MEYLQDYHLGLDRNDKTAIFYWNPGCRTRAGNRTRLACYHHSIKETINRVVSGHAG